jgi:hypothetical protein
VRDPHVQKLYYEVSSGEGISYKDPEDVAFSNQLGAFDIRDGKLSVAPPEHFANDDHARQAIEPFLRAWEIETDLNSNVGMIRFKFDRAEVIDRDPPPPGTSQVIEAKAGEMITLGEGVSFHLTCSKYPQPPIAFRTTPEVEIGYRRWIAFRAGKEPLQSMAYFVLTLLESVAGGRQEAARIFYIDFPVLSTIGRLSSTKGDSSTARKIDSVNPLEELSGPEKQWLEQAIRRVIRRLGEHASGAPLTRITLTDLPKL